MKKHWLLLFAIILFACGLSSTGAAPAVTSNLEATIAAGIQLTQAAGGAQAPAQPGATAIPEVTATAGPEVSATPAASSGKLGKETTFEFGTKELTLGKLEVSLPRQGTVVYGFKGTDGQDMAVSILLSNAHPKMQFCDKRGMQASWSVWTDQKLEVEPQGLTDSPNKRVYTLPYTGIYYLHVSCAGSGCDAFCAQIDILVKENQ